MVSLPTVPLLVWEYLTFRAEGYTSGFETMVVLAAVLLAVSWLLPHRRSLRGLRFLAAGAAFTLALLPLLLVALMAAAMAGA
ncbi:hypothetical protein GCM10023237_38840 [Streptomyces coeruleoprunus]